MEEDINAEWCEEWVVTHGSLADESDPNSRYYSLVSKRRFVMGGLTKALAEEIARRHKEDVEDYLAGKQPDFNRP